jgi:chromosome partitioning protein
LIVTIASYKGGVGKTTTAIHLAGYFQNRGKTILLDADRERHALDWDKAGPGLPFRVAPYTQAAALVKNFEHVVIDTGQRPTDEDMQATAEAGENELLILPVVPLPMDTKSTLRTVAALQDMKSSRFRVLLTKVGPDDSGAAAELRGYLAEINAPVFKAEIPRLKAFARASGEGVTVDKSADRHAARAWQAYADVGKEITG